MSDPIKQHFHGVSDLPIGDGPGRIPTTNMVEALIAAASSGGGFFVIRPLAVPNPAQGIYTDFATAHAAAVVLNRPVPIWVDSPGAPVVVADNTYDMSNITLNGWPSPVLFGAGFVPASPHTLITNAAVFTNFVNGTNFLNISHEGLAPLATFTIPPGGPAIYIRTGEMAGWFRTSGNPGPMISVVSLNPGTGVAGLEVGTNSILNGQAGEPILEVTDLALIQIRLYSGSFAADSLAGPAGQQVQWITLDGVIQGQTDFSGTETIVSNPALQYVSTTPAQWVGGPNFLNLQAAFNRMVALLNTLNGGPIP